MSTAEHATLAGLSVFFWAILPALILWRGRDLPRLNPAQKKPNKTTKQ